MSLAFALLLLSAAESVPQNLQVPADQKLLFQLHGKGFQIYSCKASDSGVGWALKAPDAQLTGSSGSVVAKHYVGPTWEAIDGSSVVGKAVANAPSPDAASVPWLLLTATVHQGRGTMNNVQTIQRLHTEGGKAPASGCDNAHAGSETRVPYQADYLFYGLNSK